MGNVPRIKTALRRVLFPAAVLLVSTAGAFGIGRPLPGLSAIAGKAAAASAEPARDTVIYPTEAYRYGPTGRKSGEAIAIDSLAAKLERLAAVQEGEDSAAVPKLSPRDSLKQLLDSTLWDKIDSIYIADSTAKAKAAFEAWYNGLSKEERKKYDNEQKAKALRARADSLRQDKERKQEIKDSILEATPRILETYAIADTMQYKRLISWTMDQDFGSVRPSVPDTSFNYHFYDHPFQRNDVNASWLGVAGSPVQYYN